MSDLLVPCDSDVSVTASGPLSHLCPFVDEVDAGTVEITWLPNGCTFELHALADYLRGFKDSALTHEQITDRIRHDLIVPGITGVRVVTTWTTADFAVEVMA